MSDVEVSSISIGIGASAGMLIAVSPMLYASVISAFGQQRVRNTSSGNIRQGPLWPRFAYSICNVWLAEQSSPASPRTLSPVPPTLPFSLVVNPHQPPSLLDVVGGDCFAPVACATQGGPGPGGGGLRPTCGRGVHHRPPQVRSCRSRRRGRSTHQTEPRHPRHQERAGQSHAIGHLPGPQRRNKGHFLWKCIVERPSASAAVPRARV